MFTIHDNTANYENVQGQQPLASLTSKWLWPNIRLVDGNSINEGRLQLNYRGSWLSVCTNSKNWTQADIDVACRQLGFRRGFWFRWYNRNNQTKQLMLERPNCDNQKRSIQECTNWHQKRIGSGVCDLHQDIGIR